jgi:electron transport complex protein RnfG
MNNSMKLGMILFLITAICAGLLGFVNQATTPVIAENKQASEQAAMKVLIEEAEEFEEAAQIQDQNIKQLYIAKSNGKAVGSIAKLAPNGYGGEIVVLVGFDAEGLIKGIKILSHAETPGLGANAADISFTDQFLQKLPPLKVVKTSPKDDEIEAITGATITSAAITESVNAAAKYITDHKQELLMEGK